MEVSQWIMTHWFDLFQTAGIIGSLLLATYTARKDAQARRIGNSIAIADQHHNIWKLIYEHPALARVLEKSVDLESSPISIREEVFVSALITHLSTVFRAISENEFVKLEGLQKDVKGFFALPIPKAVWQKLQPFQDRKFLTFIEDCLGFESSTIQ